MIVVIEVNYKGLASVISWQHRRNVWKGTAAFGRAARQSYADGLNFWHQEILPLHFKGGSQKKYGYQARKKPYSKLKRRLAQGYPSRGRKGERIRGKQARVIKGGVVDIVRSGLTERQATRGVVTLVAGPKQGVLTFNVPHYITIRHRSGKPRMDRELVTITADEISRVSEVAGKSFFTALKQEARNAPSRKFRPR